jgi:hypothetical protein
VTAVPCRANIEYCYPTAATRLSDTELMTLPASTPMFNTRVHHIIHREAAAAAAAAEADTVVLEDMEVAPVHIFHPDTRNR